LRAAAFIAAALVVLLNADFAAALPLVVDLPGAFLVVFLLDLATDAPTPFVLNRANKSVARAFINHRAPTPSSVASA
jgi:hypothetical protein